MIDGISKLKGVRKIAALTAYDYPSARILSSKGVDILLVGDSLGMVVFGYENTHFVTLDDIIRHGRAVMRGNQGSLVVIDMPYGTCDSPKEAVNNCRKVCEMTGAQIVKIEGKPECVRAVIESGIAVMGHSGLKPQEVNKYCVQGKDDISRKALINEALALQDAGVFSLILECIPSELGKEITDRLSIPTIGIGAGPHTDGQILVLHDILGLSFGKRPKFVRQYVDMASIIGENVSRFILDVQSGGYPKENESY